MTRNEFFENNKNYIKKLIVEYFNKYAYFGVEYDDLFQTAALAVLDKYDLYDESKGATTTYITYIVKTSLTAYIDDCLFSSHVPRELIYHSKKLFSKKQEFFSLNKREMTKEEMIDYLKEFVEDVDEKYLDKLIYINEYCLRVKTLDIDEEVFIDKEVVEDRIKLEDTINISESFEDLLIDEIITENVIEYLKKIEPIDYELLLEKYGLVNGISRRYREMAKERGVSHQSLEQKIKRIDKLIEARKGTFKKLIK